MTSNDTERTWTVRTMMNPDDESDFVTTEHSAFTATDAQIEGIAAALRVFGVENMDSLRSSSDGRLIYVQTEREDGSSLTIGHTYGPTLPAGPEVAAALLEQTFTDLRQHMDDPDNSRLTGQGMLELTLDRLATLRTLIAGPNLSATPTPPRRTASPARATSGACHGQHYFPAPEELGIDPEAFPALRGNCVCGEQYNGQDDQGETAPAGEWQDTRDDDGRWLTGSSACPRGCGHVVMAHRTDVGCITCDCEHGIPERPAPIDRLKSHVLPADLAGESDA